MSYSCRISSRPQKILYPHNRLAQAICRASRHRPIRMRIDAGAAANNTLKTEIFRKSIHIIGFIVPFISLALGIMVAAVFVIGMMTVYSISEYMRLKGRRSIPMFTAITKMAMRNERGNSHNEKQNTFIKAPLYFATGILLSLLIFTAPFNYVAIAVATLGDGFASIIGRLYGRNKIPHSGGKTIEGTAAGLAFAFAGCLIFVSPTIAIIAASIGMITELLHLRVSDNLSVPLITGLALTIIGTL